MNELIGRFVNAIINPAIRFLFIIALAYFLFGVVQFIRNSDNETERTKGKQHMLWGVIGLAIMVSVFAIMNIALGTIESLAK